MPQPASAALILIVEDEPKLAAVLSDYFSAAGYRTSWIADGSEVIQRIRENPPDLVILDLMLPQRDGLSICRELREFSRVPVVMVTARVEEIDRLVGLEVGADDYVCKPFSPREVVARVKAVLRRNAEPRDAPTGLAIDEDRYLASLDGRQMDLTPVEFRLLRILTASPGKVFSRSQLLDRLYEDHRIVADRTVDSHIKNLRRKLQSIRGDAELIVSVYGVGYKCDL